MFYVKCQMAFFLCKKYGGSTPILAMPDEMQKCNPLWLFKTEQDAKDFISELVMVGAVCTNDSELLVSMEDFEIVKIFTYGDLNLKSIAKKCGLDVSHYTFRGQCSCCADLTQFSKRYWVGEVKDDPLYLMLKNANNGSGEVCRNDIVGFKKDSHERTVYGMYNVKDMKQLKEICSELQNQLGKAYKVVVPKNTDVCIEIQLIDFDARAYMAYHHALHFMNKPLSA